MGRDSLKFCLIFVYLVLIGCREDLVHLGSELDANRVLFALRDKGIEASKSSIGKEWVVRIATTDLTGALRILEEKKIFQEPADGLGETSSNVFHSKEEKKDIRDKDLSRSLSSSIRLIPFVKDARVHIYNTYNDPLDLDPKNERSASVLVVHDPGKISEDLIKELVSRGAGLLRENVSIIFVLAEVKKEALESNIEEKVSPDSENEYSFEWIRQKFKESANSYYVAIYTSPLILFLYFLFKKIKLKRKNISRTDILDKLNEERLRHEPT